ncbi:hypothetical protein [Bosea sp. BH3]|uniref:hypothetical protein n=1 Tax=Bosea sp. BH3 TaxID=2871701 RepID=UPI0021CB4407|nr:hypothetical protein [Bosea sp. BH3]MCU4179550.1 hypothetical protein [Bosea sp. BH3]
MKHRPASDFIPSFDSFDADEFDFEVAAETDAPLPFIAAVAHEPAPLPVDAIELPAFLPKSPRPPKGPDLDEVFETGRQAGLAEQQSQSQQELDRQRGEAARILEEERRRWAEEVAAPLAAQISAALDTLGESLADRVGRLLQPFLGTELRDTACRSLIAQIGPLLAGADGAVVRVHGPALLLATLRNVFPAGGAVEFVESEQTEVTVATTDTIIETRIGDWVARLEGRGPDRRRRPSAI